MDGLRGVAIIMVVLTHVSGGAGAALSIVRNTNGWSSGFNLPFWLAKILESSANGVQLFFVVSAFTLTIRACQTKSDLKGYALRRIARVGPAYWLSGIAYTLFSGLAPRLWAPNGVSPVDLGIAAVFGSVWQGGAAFAIVPGGWSVCDEIAFYVALPFIIRLINGRIPVALALTVFSMVCAEVWSLYLKHIHAWGFQANCAPIYQAPVFMWGITAALVAMRYELRSRPTLAIVLILTALIVVPLVHVPGIAPHIVFAMVVAMATALVARHSPSLLGGRAIGRVGEVSYSLYLIHFAILFGSFRAATSLIPAGNALTLLLHFAITFPASFALASVSYRFIEQPGIRWAARRLRNRDSLRLAGVGAG